MEKSEKLTFGKYVEIVKGMRDSGDYRVDVSRYDEEELRLLIAMVKSDAIFELCNAAKYEDMEAVLNTITLYRALKENSRELKRLRDEKWDLERKFKGVVKGLGLRQINR